MPRVTSRVSVVKATARAGVAQAVTPTGHATYSYFVDEIGRNPILFETLNFAESMAFAFSPAFADAMALEDVLETAATYARTVADSVTLADVIVLAFNKALSDTLAVTDSLAFGVAKPLSDSYMLTDTTDTILTPPGPLPDYAALTDTGTWAVYNYAGADYFAADYVYASTGSF